MFPRIEVTGLLLRSIYLEIVEIKKLSFFFFSSRILVYSPVLYLDRIVEVDVKKNRSRKKSNLQIDSLKVTVLDGKLLYRNVRKDFYFEIDKLSLNITKNSVVSYLEVGKLYLENVFYPSFIAEIKGKLSPINLRIYFFGKWIDIRTTVTKQRVDRIEVATKARIDLPYFKVEPLEGKVYFDPRKRLYFFDYSFKKLQVDNFFVANGYLNANVIGTDLDLYLTAYCGDGKIDLYLNKTDRVINSILNAEALYLPGCVEENFYSRKVKYPLRIKFLSLEYSFAYPYLLFGNGKIDTVLSLYEGNDEYLAAGWASFLSGKVIGGLSVNNGDNTVNASVWGLSPLNFSVLLAGNTKLDRLRIVSSFKDFPIYKGDVTINSVVNISPLSIKGELFVFVDRIVSYFLLSDSVLIGKTSFTYRASEFATLGYVSYGESKFFFDIGKDRWKIDAHAVDSRYFMNSHYYALGDVKIVSGDKKIEFYTRGDLFYSSYKLCSFSGYGQSRSNAVQLSNISCASPTLQLSVDGFVARNRFDFNVHRFVINLGSEPLYSALRKKLYGNLILNGRFGKDNSGYYYNLLLSGSGVYFERERPLNVKGVLYGTKNRLIGNIEVPTLLHGSVKGKIGEQVELLLLPSTELYDIIFGNKYYSLSTGFIRAYYRGNGLLEGTIDKVVFKIAGSTFFNDTPVTFKLGKSRKELTFSLISESDQYIAGKLISKNGGKLSGGIQAKLNIDSLNELLDRSVKNKAKIGGTLSLLLSLVDDDNRSGVYGQARWDTGFVEIDSLPSIKNIEAIFYIDGGKITLEELHALFGNGYMLATGELLDFQKGSLLVGIKNMHLKNLYGLDISGDANLAFYVNGNDVDLTGNLELEKIVFYKEIQVGITDILRSILERRVENVVGEKSGIDLFLRINVNNLIVDSNIATVKGSAELVVTEDLFLPEFIGTIYFHEGSVKYMATDYDIKEGYLRFIKKRSYDPYLYFNLETSKLNYLVNVTLIGFLSQFKVFFTSTPPLAKEEIVAILLGGEEEKGILDFLIQQTAEVATKRIESIVGVDLLRVEPATEGGEIGGTRVVVGKRLTDDVEFVYTYNPLLPERNVYKLRLTLGKNTLLEMADEGDGSYSASLKWEIDF